MSIFTMSVRVASAITVTVVGAGAGAASVSAAVGSPDITIARHSTVESSSWRGRAGEEFARRGTRRDWSWIAQHSRRGVLRVAKQARTTGPLQIYDCYPGGGRDKGVCHLTDWFTFEFKRSEGVVRYTNMYLDF